MANKLIFFCLFCALIFINGPVIAAIQCGDAGTGEPCCGDAILDEGEYCDDGNNVGGDGCSALCTGECAIHTDCLQGEFCYKGTCVRDQRQDVYHCNKSGCPPGHWCMTTDNTKDRCPEDENYECNTACDCGPAHACIDIPNIGRRCVKDIEDPWISGGYAIFGISIPENEPTYCCKKPVCFAGRIAYGNNADSFRCYDSYNGITSLFCGGKPCYFEGDCDAGEACVDTRTRNPIPGRSCNPDGGRCIGNASAEAIFGYAPSELLIDCDSLQSQGVKCEAGWKPGGIAAVSHVIAQSGTCGNSVCDPGEFPDTCSDCFCGDGICAPSEFLSCEDDCGRCGDGVCGQLESPKNCGEDCFPICGDNSCDELEITSCPEDCLCGEVSVTFDDYPSVCGDGICQSSGQIPENCVSCSRDCGEPVDTDEDSVADCIDNCMNASNPYQEDFDVDHIGDVCDTCPLDPENDSDGDGFCGDVDNCPNISNPDQTDSDFDDFGNICDEDDDNDSVLDSDDNCPLHTNTNQLDFDRDGFGDECDYDDDNDGVQDGVDQCLSTVNGELTDNDGCSINDFCNCGNDWKNHGSYVVCVSKISKHFLSDGLIDKSTHGFIVAEAARSECGYK